MTVKAGQKCTAIRRALVPAALVDAVGEAAAARLAKVVIGNPADEAVRMGALASLDQREEVRRSLKALLVGRPVVFGDPDHVRWWAPTRTAARSCRPILIRVDDAARPEPHEVEAFGPVSTLIGYRDTGGGDRAGRARTRQPGRVDRHRRRRLRPRGGAGGRSVARPVAGAGRRRRRRVHRARFTVAGARARRSGSGRRWRGDGRHPRGHAPHAAHGGAGQPEGPRRHHRSLGDGRRAEDGVHPFRKSLAELRVGDSVVAGPRPVTLADIAHFAEFTGDTFYAHTDAEAAPRTPSSTASSPTATSSCRWRPGCSSTPTRGRCWPTMASTIFASLRRCTPATSSP